MYFYKNRLNPDVQLASKPRKWISRQWWAPLLLLVFTLTTGVIPAYAEEQALQLVDHILCNPNPANLPKENCLMLGPIAYRLRMAEAGIVLPVQKLPAESPQKELRVVPYRYARVVTANTPTFRSLEDAVNNEPILRTIREGYDFVSYIDQVTTNGKTYLMIAPGEWIRRDDVNLGITPASFQGLIFQRTPRNNFGWVLYPTESKHTPGYQTKDFTGRKYNRYDVVQIYGISHVDEWDWFLIGPDEWVEQRMVGAVTINPEPPNNTDTKRWIEINLFEQTIAVYENRRLVFATLMSSGTNAWWTRPGLFKIYQKLATTNMQGAFEADWSDYYYLEDVPWTMYFDEARALHGEYWHNGFGYPRSHGCVNLSVGDAKWLFDWAQDGDWVYVWDPSGKTPVDPDLYTPGGA